MKRRFFLSNPAHFGAIFGSALLAAVGLGCESEVSQTTTGGTAGAGGGGGTAGAGGGPTCESGLSLCDGACVDIATNAAHCGTCGVACAVGEACVAGTCNQVCLGGTTNCGNVCVNTQNDASHCGACDNACAPGEVCDVGACVLICSGGTTKCGNTCANLGNDPNHCGSCNNACPIGTVCMSGNCESICGPGTSYCNGSCVDTMNNPAHCGACDTPCPATPNAMPTCVNATCANLCNMGYGDCNMDAADGCEVPTASDANHCGGCGMACPSGANSTATCTDSSCGIMCTGAFANCDNDPLNGCEVDTQTNAAHCGTCGNACPAVANATSTCNMGACVFTCNAPFADCNMNAADGCEADTQSASAHCGVCGNACAANQGCLGGMCVTLSLRQLSGTHTVDVTRGSTHNAFFSDPVTGKVYWGQSYFSNPPLTEYPDMANFVANTNGVNIPLQIPREGTYHAALGGYVYYNQAGSNTMVRALASTGAPVNTAPLVGAGFQNQSHFNWGGYSDIAFYTDTGNLMYVLYAAPGGGNMTISRIDPVSLALQQTWTVPRTKTNTGYAFVVNGTFYFGPTYNSPAIAMTYNLATSTYDTTYVNSLSPVSGDYITAMYWDPGSKNLLEQSNGHSLVYPNIP